MPSARRPKAPVKIARASSLIATILVVANIDCSVRNVSNTGAALDVTSPIGIPDQFALVLRERICLCPAMLSGENSGDSVWRSIRRWPRTKRLHDRVAPDSRNRTWIEVLVQHHRTVFRLPSVTESQ